MTRKECDLYPSRHGLDEARLLKFARSAAALLAPGFYPPTTRIEDETETDSYGDAVRLQRLLGEGA